MDEAYLDPFYVDETTSNRCQPRLPLEGKAEAGAHSKTERWFVSDPPKQALVRPIHVKLDDQRRSAEERCTKEKERWSRCVFYGTPRRKKKKNSNPPPGPTTPRLGGNRLFY